MDLHLHRFTQPQVPVHLIIFYLNFRADGFSHDGLGVNGAHAARVLRKEGIWAEVHCVKGREDIERHITETVTHAVIEAPWLPSTEVAALMRKFPRVQWCCRMHAQIGFLQVDRNAFKHLDGYRLLTDGDVGFCVAANHKTFCRSFEAINRSPCLYLPNLYDLDRSSRKRPMPHTHRLLRVSSFGALRPMKNHVTAAAAAMILARQRNCDLEFWVSTGRDEQHGVLQGITNLFAGRPWAKLVGNGWQAWADFRQAVARVDLAIQASYTESFNIVSADAAAEGVPCVVSAAVDWMPAHCQANHDDENEIARVGSFLLNDPHVVEEAHSALAAFVANGVRLWKEFLGLGRSRAWPYAESWR